METRDLILGKAKFDDWKALYQNVWSRPETARYMQWRLSANKEDAKARIMKTMAYQAAHDTYVVYEKESGQAIGFAGLEEVSPRIYQETGIALGPEFTGRGYGKQILQLLLKYCAETLGGEEFYYSTRAENTAAKALAASCGFTYRYSEQKTDLRSGQPYELEVYSYTYGRRVN